MTMDPEMERDQASEDGATEQDTAPGRVPRTGPLYRLYRWVLHWADTPFGGRALFGISFIESIFFPIPPDPLLLALGLGAPKKALRFAALATAASVVGGLVGYAIGAGAWDLFGDFFFEWVPGVSEHAFTRVQTLYDRYGFLAIFLAGLTPIPYKVFTLTAGIFSIDLGVFLVASLISRGLRFTIEALLIRIFGAPIAEFIERYFNILTLLFGLLIVLGFLAVTVVF